MPRTATLRWLRGIARIVTAYTAALDTLRHRPADAGNQKALAASRTGR